MAEEGKKFSERSSRLADFSTRLQGNGGSTTGGSGTQQTQQTQQTGIGNTSGTQSSGGIFLPGITDNAELQSMNKLPKTGFQGAIEQGKVQGNVVLPGITGKTATTISHIDPHEAIEGMQRFREQEEDRTTGQYRPLVKRGAEHLKGQYQKRAQANLSKSAILERLANIGMANGASKEAMTPYVEEHKEKTLKYNKQINDAFSDWEKRNMDMDLLKQYEGETISGLFSRGDGKGATYKIIKGLSENMNMIPEMIVAMVAPQVGLPMIGTDVYIQESQGTFEELMENGATYEQAQNGAVIVGIANATIEMILERLLGGVQRAGASTLRRLFLKNMQKEAVRNIAKKGFAEILSRGLWNQAKSSGVEGLEEILQQWVTNAFVKMVNPDRKLGEGTLESFDQAFWQSLFMPLGGGSESIIRDVQTNKEVDARTDLEAIKYVAEGEERKAQRLQQAKQRMKQRFLNPTMDNGYTPSEEQAEQRANEREENEEFEDEMKRENQEGPNYTEEDEQRFTREGTEEQQQADELRSRQNEEVTIENEMAKEALSENINEDLGDPRYQKIDEDLQDIKDSLEKMDDNTFFNRIMSSINKGNKNYVVTTDKNGNKSVLRVVERGGNGKGSNGKTVTVQVMQPSKKSGNVSVNEFTYTPGNLTTDQKQGIITGFENWGKTGNFRDKATSNERYQLKYEEKGYKPGVAGKNEKSISGKEGVQQRNKINDETIEQLAKKYGVRVDVIKGLIKVLKDGKWNGKDRAYGMYLDQVLTLSEQIKESTAPHELLHAIFDMIDPETKAYLISQVMKSEGWSAKQAEEWLADTFSNFFRTGKIEGAPKSTWGKIKIFFKRVRSFINGLGKWRSELEEIFTDIITSEGIEDLQGKIDQNQKLAEGKARMKKRFMEYAKNAQKVEKKKSKSEVKYQTVDGSEREVKAEVIQAPVKGKMYHVTTEEFENFRESDQYDDEERWDRNDSYGTYVTDAQQFFEDFTESSPRDNGSGWKKWEIDVDLKKPVLHPYRTWKEFGVKNADEMIIDWMILVDRFTPEMQKELVAMKMQDYDYENFDYDEYPYKDSYTKEEILALPGSISSNILDQQFQGEGEEIINYLWGDHASEDRETLKKKGYDAIMIYEGDKDGAIFSYALFYPNKFSKNKTDAKYQTVYHGSPYEFENFDSANMGKGEGAQAHGWGHYVAIDEKTGRHYAELNSRMGYAKYKGETLNDLYRSVNLRSPEGEEKSLAVDILTAHKDYNLSISEAIKKSKEYYENEIKKYEDFLKDEGLAEMHKTYRSLIEKYKKKIDIIDNMKESDFTGTDRNLYEVDIPDPVKTNTPTGSNYLEEDGEITKAQMDKVYSEIVKEFEKKKGGKAKRVQNLVDGKLKTFRNLIDEAPGMLSDGKGLYFALSNVLGGPKQASKFLESLGYDGIHYYGGRDGEAYVIFNDDDLEITNHEKYQLADDLESEAFKKRFGDSKVVDKDGNPLVVYHGTPFGEFWIFNKNKASMEGDRGAGFYFTDSDYDANANYVGGGPDFDNKVTRLAERIEQDEGIPYEEASKKARDQLHIGDNKIDAVLKIENPVRVGEDATDIIGEWRDNAVEEYNEEDFDNEDDYYRALDEARANALDDIHRAIWNIGLDYGIDDAIQKVDQRFMENDYGTAQQLKDYLNDGSLETMMGDQYANNEVARAVLEGLGYDGIIDNSVSEKFRNMGLNYGTTHYIVFEPNQIKSATDNKGTYDPNYNDIRYQTVYHGSPAEFDRFDSTHMGEGEGAQAHGWGHYVAVEKDTGRHYAGLQERVTGGVVLKIDGKPYKEVYESLSDFEKDAFDSYKALRVNDYTNDEAWDKVKSDKVNEVEGMIKQNKSGIEYFQNMLKDKPDDAELKEIIKWSKKQLKKYRDEKSQIPKIDELRKRVGTNNNLYEVEIPDPEKADTPTGWNYIEEKDKPTKEFIDAVVEKINYDGGREELFFDEQVRDIKKKGNIKEILRERLEHAPTYRAVYNTIVDMYGGELRGQEEASKFLESLGYKGIHYYGGRDGEAYVIFNDDDLEITNHEKYQIAEYDYDENGNRKWLKFGEENEFNPNIFGEPTKQDKIEEDMEKEKGNAFYDSWKKFNIQRYKDDQLTMDEFLEGVATWINKKQDEYDQKMRDLAEAQTDPKMLDLQLRAVKLMEEEGQVGKKFGKNVSKEVRARQQAEVEKKREQLIKDIFDWMYPGLRFEDATYNDQMRADEKEAEWEMLGKEGIEEKLKYFKKDKNGDWEAKDIKIEDPEEQWNKIAKSGNFDEVFTPTDRVLEWKTPQGQKGRIDSKADPKKFKKIMEKINNGTTKTKVTLRDVTQEARALEKQRAMEEAERERKKKEKAEAMAKKKQDEYKKLVRMKAFQRLVDMQWFERYPFLTEDEIKKRYGFTDQEWKDITEQNEIKLPKKRGEKARSDFNKAVDSHVKTLIEGLGWQNNLKRKDAEKDLGEIGKIDLDVLLGRDEEKGQKEVEEFEKLAGEKQPEDKNKKAQELTNKWKTDVQEMFRKAEEKRNERYANKEEKEIDEVKTVDEAKKLTKGSRWKRVKDFWKDTTIQDLIQPISSRIEKISPRIYLELMRFEQRISIKENVRMKQVEDFVKKMAKIRSKNKKDYLNITLHLLNGNVGTANQMLEKYGTSIPRQLLDEIWADAEDVGYTMNYEGFYYPRKVKDVEAFLDRFVKTEEKSVQGEIDKIIRKKEKQAMERGEEFTAQQKADLINQLLMDGEVEGISLGSGHMKKRKVATITKDMLQFYEDPVDALLQYITSMTEAVEKARFLGQGKRGDIKSLGEFIADEGITGYDADELKKLLLSRFNYAPMGNMMSKLKVSANIIHLGSPSSALSQLADVSFSLIENGLVNLVQGLSRKYNIDLDALGITNRGEELRTQGKNETKWEKLQRFTFKMTGFNMMDQFGKKSFVVSTLNKLIKYAKKGDPQLRKDLERWFDDPKMIDQVIEDLKEGRMSENVNLFLFTKLADVQPLTRTQMTNTYLRAGNWRVLYAFKTFGIKQLDYIIQRGKRELATKPTAKALRSIVTMLGIIMLCGASDDELKDFSMGRKYSSWIWRMIEGNDRSASQLSDRFWDNFLKLLGFTKYSIYQARTQGIKSAIEDIFFSLPGLDLFTYPMQDIQDAMSEDGLDFSQASSWQLIPIIGKYGYRWVGAGQTKQQKSLGKEKKKKKKGSGSGGVRSKV